MSDRVLVDTNIYVEIFRNNDAELQDIVDSFTETCINTIVFFELVRGEPGKRRYAAMERYLGKYRLLHLSPGVCETAVNLMREHHFSHGLEFPDALIAATCLEHSLFLYTKNSRDFDFISGLKII